MTKVGYTVGNEHDPIIFHAGVPCEDGEPTPSDSPTTNPLSTKTPRLCMNGPFTAFKRKNGYWCAILYTLQVPGSQPYEVAVDDCVSNRMMLSSIETDEEWDYWGKNIPAATKVNVTGVWMGASYNESAQKWYWDDGQATPTMAPQPKVVTPGGKVAWFLYEGDRVLKVSNTTLDSTVWVNGYICGYPVPA
uniref:Lectin n=1 Tax=Caenorhabditis tropicalis TaxID=1561998 RepID=A0A1I7V4A9_9PELO